MSRLTEFLKNFYKKIILVALLCLTAFVFDQMEFPKVDALIRDSLQYLNSTDKIDKSLVTVNIDSFSKESKKPFSFEYIKQVIDTLESYEPKSIVLLIEPSELEKVDERLSSYLTDKKNIYLDIKFMDGLQNNSVSLVKFPRYLDFDIAHDSAFGAKDRKHRRVMLTYFSRGPSPSYDALERIGYAPLPLNNFKNSFNLWETKQAYIKIFLPSQFGNYQFSNLINNKINLTQLKGKTILLDAFDEWSHLSSPSIFNVFDTMSPNSFKTDYYSYASSVANLINFFTTGDYIKYIDIGQTDITLVTLVLCLILFLNISLRIKFTLFLSIIPFFTLFIIALYLSNCLYLNLSRSISYVIFVQYIGMPFLFFSLINKTESERIDAINSARINAFLTISEKVAHDIKSPISALKIVSSKLKIDNVQYSEIITQSLQKIEDISQEILNSYRPSFDRKSKPKEPMNIMEVIQKCVEEKRVIASHVIFNVPSDNYIFATANAHDLSTVLSNILDNSIEALDNTPTPVIDIFVKSGKKSTSIQILDNGKGIPSEVLVLLGTQRYTSKASTNRNGIALLHAKHLLSLMSAELEITSNVKKGTSIVITLIT